VDSLEPLSDKLRLYVLRERSEQMDFTSNNTTHGYDIARPNESFQQFGPHVLIILRMLKCCISFARVPVSAL